MHRRHRALPTRVYVWRRIAVVVALVLVAAVVISTLGRSTDVPSPTADDTTTTTTKQAPPAPACDTGRLVGAEDPDTGWATVVVDTNRRLPSSFEPHDLVDVAEAGFAPGLEVRSFVIDDLRALREAAAANGTPLAILAAYRSFQVQQQLLDQRVAEFGEDEALRRVARPGHSEHQLGTTIDVTSEGLDDVDQAWASSPTGQWVADNAHRFGFLISYPQGLEDVTCYTFEPWHLRYVGRDLAAEVLVSGLTLREYLYAHHTPLGAGG